MPDKMQVPDYIVQHMTALMQSRESPAYHGGDIKMRCEVTAMIPCFNCIGSVVDTIRSLTWGKQSIPFRVIMAENGSQDGTQDLLRALMKPTVTRKFWTENTGFRDLTVVEVPQDDCYPVEGRQRYRYNIRACFQEMIRHVKTDYVLFLDSDVEVPVGGARTMLEALKADPNIGWCGITYDNHSNHLQHGLATMPAKKAAELIARLEMRPRKGSDGRFFYPCMCSQLEEMVLRDGLKSEPLDPLSARHKRLEQ